MPGVLPKLVEHQLSVQRRCRLVWQWLRRFHPARKEVIKQEVDKLLEVRLVKEIQYPEWLFNVVVVPKKNSKCQVCVDYTNLNDTCPNDTFPLPRIDQIVDAIVGHELLSFLDAYSGYNQILIYPPDEVKTAFITPFGMYYYRVMPFGLKNVGATY